jgi:phosphoenolpyruvate carboxylase
MARVARPRRRVEPIERLRDDVRLLGELVGEVLREQGGPDLLAAVEQVRTAAIALRSPDAPPPRPSSSPTVGNQQARASAASGVAAVAAAPTRAGEASTGRDEAAEDGLLRWAEAQNTPRLLQLARAFSVYFHVINLAEQHHRLRTLRERERTGEPLHESLAAAVAAIAQAGGVPRGARNATFDFGVHPVFTAHPSEARRRTLLNHLEATAAAIAALDDPQAVPRRRAATLDDLRTRITLIWQTAEARVERPSVLDEVQSVLYVLAGVVYDVAPALWRACETAWAEIAGVSPVRAPQLLRFGSWVGGDRDGNPAVTPEVTRAAARLARAAVLRRYGEDARALGRALSISRRLVGASDELLASLDRERTDLGVEAVAEWRDEPYRRKLGLVAERLRRTASGQAGGYAVPADLLEDLELVDDSLRAHGGARIAAGALRDFRCRVEAFGFHLAELELRQHANRHTAAVAELLGLVGVTGYATASETERQALLDARLPGAPLALPTDALSPETRETLDTFHAMADVQAQGGPAACATYIVSMSRAPSDLLAVLFLAREAGLFAWDGGEAAHCALDVVPLFEEIEELRACGEVLEGVLV